MTPLSLELVRLMKAAEVSQAGLASMMGVAESTVLRWTTGAITPGVPRICDIAEALGVPYAQETLMRAAAVRT